MRKKETSLLDKVASLSKRRGFIFQSSEIYGGLSSCWDYGPYGVELKMNIKALWWRQMVSLRDDIVGVDSSILMHKRVWEASGHVESFTDPLVECKKCHKRFRADDITGGNTRCPECGGELTEPRLFNLMFRTVMGPVEEGGSVVYLRPETAQGIYVNFLNIMIPSRKKPPFGIAQIGKAFRNEISPGNFIFRSREFEQMEMQYFIPPEAAEKWFEYWKEERMRWYINVLGLRAERLRFRPHAPDELAHYARVAVDIEYNFPFGWKELEGIHDRGDFDLRRHREYSGEDLSYYDPEQKKRYIPYIIETSGGVDRTILAVLCDAFEEEEERIVLKLHPNIAPYLAGVFPLVNRDGMPDIARRIFNELRGDFRVFFDTGGTIGRRYRRQDEAGTPYCITIDSQTIEDETVTVRERDTMAQVRVKANELKRVLRVLPDCYQRDKGFELAEKTHPQLKMVKFFGG